MLKVMIVDDEIIVRVGFQSCINWEALRMPGGVHLRIRRGRSGVYEPGCA